MVCVSDEEVLGLKVKAFVSGGRIELPESVVFRRVIKGVFWEAVVNFEGLFKGFAETLETKISKFSKNKRINL